MSHIDRMDAVGEILHLGTTNLATIIAAAYTQGLADAACHKVIGEKRHFLDILTAIYKADAAEQRLAQLIRLTKLATPPF